MTRPGKIVLVLVVDALTTAALITWEHAHVARGRIRAVLRR